MFGPGKADNVPGLRLATSPSLSCVAEFSAPVTNPAVAVAGLLMADGITLTPCLPTLWLGFAPHFVALLLCPETPVAIAEHDPGRLVTQLGGLAVGTTKHLRLNFPVRSETIDTPFPRRNPRCSQRPSIRPVPLSSWR